jgi:hypothetical protein
MTPPFISSLIVLGVGAFANPPAAPAPVRSLAPWGETPPRRNGPVARVPVLPALYAAYPRRLAAR